VKEEMKKHIKWNICKNFTAITVLMLTTALGLEFTVPKYCTYIVLSETVYAFSNTRHLMTVIYVYNLTRMSTAWPLLSKS